MIVNIPLGKGRFAVLDEADYGKVIHMTWNYLGGYAAGRRQNKVYLMHRLIMGITNPEIDVDHRDNDGLNNRRENLRICTNQQNSYNRPPNKNNTTGFKGVSPDSKGKYQAAIGHKGKMIHLGRFVTPEEAARAYDKAAIDIQGEFAYLNFPGAK